MEYFTMEKFALFKKNSNYSATKTQRHKEKGKKKYSKIPLTTVEHFVS